MFRIIIRSTITKQVSDKSLQINQCAKVAARLVSQPALELLHLSSQFGEDQLPHRAAFDLH